MGKDVLIRGIDDSTYNQISKNANDQGVTVTSFIKNIVDMKIKDQSTVLQKHDLILYENGKDLEFMMKSLDRLTKDSDMMLTFCAPINSKLSKLLTKLKWFDATVKPQEKNIKKFSEYTSKIVKKIVKEANGKQVCWIDGSLDDAARDSLKEALAIEAAYNINKLHGMTFCVYNFDSLLHKGVGEMLEFFKHHDQVFMLKNQEILKIHITKENTQKLLLE